MRLLSLRYILGFLSLWGSGLGFSQKNNPSLENAGIFIFSDGTKLVGELLTFQAPYKIRIYTKDTVTIDPLTTEKMYLPDEVAVYKKSRFQYKKGFQGSLTMGMSGYHFNSDVTLGNLFQDRYELALGVGTHTNFMEFSTTSSRHSGTLVSIPIFAKGRYYFVRNYTRWYATGKLGFSRNLISEEITSVQNGILMEGGIGVQFAAKKRNKYFMELSQYTLSAQGTLRNNDSNGIGDINFDLWFNRIVFTVGMQFGR